MTNNKNKGLGRRGWWWALALAVLTGALGLPVGGYMLGKRLIGAYEGRYGLTDFVGSIYAGVGRGELPALLIVGAPLAILGIWYLVARAWPRPA